MQLSIVTTLFDSEKYIEEFCNRSHAAASEVADSYEILLVNDGSPDNSLQIAKNIAAKHPVVKVIDLYRNFGQHKAMMTGLDYARGDYVFLIDSDLEEDPELLDEFWNILNNEEDVDVVYGIQKNRKGKFIERTSGNFFYRVFNSFSSIKVPPNLITARLMTRRYVDALLQFKEHEVFMAGIWSAAGFKQKPVPVIKKTQSRTTYNFRRKLGLVINSITAFSNKPLLLASYFGFFIVFVSSLFVIKITYQKLIYNITVTGWTSLMVSMWFLGGLVIFFIGVISIYLSKVFIETKKRPYSIVRDFFAKPKTEDFNPIKEQIESYYTEKIAKHGPTHHGVDWNSQESQEIRFSQLLKVCEDSEKLILNELGCGYGALVEYLEKHGLPYFYYGYDLSDKMIEHAENIHSANEHARFFIGDEMKRADYTVASGLFNVKSNTDDNLWTAYILDTLGKMNVPSDKGFAFNMLTKYSDAEYMRNDLYYGDPCFFFDYCKTHFSKDVSLIHDYGLYEFTLLVKKVAE